MIAFFAVAAANRLFVPTLPRAAPEVRAWASAPDQIPEFLTAESPKVPSWGWAACALPVGVAVLLVRGSIVMSADTSFAQRAKQWLMERTAGDFDEAAVDAKLDEA